MKKYTMEIKKVLQREFAVKTKNQLDINLQINCLYHDSQMVLDTSDYVQRNIIARRDR